MNIRCIVTGGAGFIGRNVAKELNRRGEKDILLVDNLGCDEKWHNLQGLEIEDIWSIQEFRYAVRENTAPIPEVVFHLGACSSTTEIDADYLLDNNYRYTRELCEWCLSHGVRFIYASSAATYGDGSRGYADDEALVPMLHPMNMYGMSKQLFDLWALRGGLFDRIVGLKYFNVYGPYEDHKDDMRSVVNKVYGEILSTGRVQLFKSYRSEFKDGAQMRDFICAKDAVDMTLFFWKQAAVGGLFNCGTGEARSWNDLAKAVFTAMGRPVQIVYKDMPESLQPKYQYYTQADMKKLRAAGYDRPFTSLENGVRDYVENYLVGRG